jgi:hypothetical protein
MWRCEVIKLNSKQAPVTPGSEPGVFLTEASDCGLPPGDFPMYVKLDGEILSRVSLDKTGAGYIGADVVLTIFND